MAKKVLVHHRKKDVNKEVENVKPVEEVVNEVPEVIEEEQADKTEVVEEEVPETPEPAEEQVVGDAVIEDEEKQVDETEVVEEVVNEAHEVIGDAIIEEEEKEITTEEIIDEYKNVTNEINNNLSNIYDENQLLKTAEQELERLDSVEELVDNKIKQLEKNKDALKKYNNINFSRFWNGVSSGWDY